MPVSGRGVSSDNQQDWRKEPKKGEENARVSGMALRDDMVKWGSKAQTYSGFLFGELHRRQHALGPRGRGGRGLETSSRDSEAVCRD